MTFFLTTRLQDGSGISTKMFGQVKYLCNFAVALQIYTNNMKQSYIQRELSGIIEEAARYFPVVTITGPRQFGKTTQARRATFIFTVIPTKMK